MTGSGYKVDGYGGAYEEERDPLGAIMGTEDPMLLFDEPTYLDMLTEGQPLYLEANPWDPNDGCEKDGAPYDCDWLDREVMYGSVVGGVFRNGRYIGQISFAGNSSGSGTASFFIQDTQTTVRAISDEEAANYTPPEPGPGGHWIRFNYNWNFSRQDRRGTTGSARGKQKKLYDGRDDNRDMAWGRAYRDTRELLKDPNCRDYIASNDATSERPGGYSDPWKHLEGLNQRGQLRDVDTRMVVTPDGSEAPAATEAWFDRNTGRVTRTGAIRLGTIFYEPNGLINYIGTVKTAREARVYTFLHELKHALSGTHATADQVREWDRNIREKCLKNLDLYLP